MFNESFTLLSCGSNFIIAYSVEVNLLLWKVMAQSFILFEVYNSTFKPLNVAWSTRRLIQILVNFYDILVLSTSVICDD